MYKQFISNLMKIATFASLSFVVSSAHASSASYDCEVTQTSEGSPLEKIRGNVNLVISKNEAGNYSLVLSYRSKSIEAVNKVANLYVSKKQNFYTGDKPSFVNVTLDGPLNGLASTGRVHLNPIWPNFSSDDYLFCQSADK